jgi:hypothetical protein
VGVGFRGQRPNPVFERSARAVSLVAHPEGATDSDSRSLLKHPQMTSMFYLGSPRLERVRSAIIPAALLCVVLAGCADNEPTAPVSKPAVSDLPRITRTDNVPFNKFFVAWSRNFSSSPIQTQNFSLDTRMNRQFGGLWPNDELLAFARANPGRLYINGDEPDQYCIDAYEYAGIFKFFVDAVRGADPTAKFSPAGFAEPNDRCCPPGDEPCRQRSHSIGYAQQFYDAYVQRFGVAPPVDEWRFHNFGLSFATGDLNAWWARVDQEASWARAHGANMVLGAWAFHGWQISPAAYNELLKQAMNRLINDPRINEAVYWSYESWAGEAHYLANEDGSLTPQGQTYANPLTDVPSGVTTVELAEGRAKLQWINTTGAWASEAEFWVRSPGSSEFVYRSTDRSASPGGTETALASFGQGDQVRGRVRYYNAYGQAEWSAFSNTISLTSGKKRQSTKSPSFCFLSKRISGACD